jgi:hypothetical protein
VAQNRTNEIVAALERQFPLWQVWVVHRVMGGPVWCARRHDDHRRILNAHSPAELQDYLEAEAMG